MCCVYVRILVLGWVDGKIATERRLSKDMLHKIDLVQHNFFYTVSNIVFLLKDRTTTNFSTVAYNLIAYKKVVHEKMTSYKYIIN
jgi:hypothetical protein